MAVVNRTLDTSEQYKVIQCGWQQSGTTTVAVVTGMTLALGVVPWPSVLAAGQLYAQGVSGSPTYQLVVKRFIAGSGYTAFNVGSANAGVDFGVSGVPVAGMSLPAAGSTLLNLLANDWLMINTGGANSAAQMVEAAVVLRPIQDIKINFGLV